MGVKVLLLKRYAGPLGNFPSGRTIEVPEAEVAGLVAAGACEPISGMQPYVSEAEAKALADAELKAKEEAEAKGKTHPAPPQAGGKETATEKAAGKREKADEK